MKPQNANPPTSPSRWKRRASLGLGVMLSVALLLGLTMDLWLTWGVNALLRSFGQDGNVERVVWEIQQGQITLLNPRWQDPESGLFITTDTLQLGRPEWTQDSIRIESLHLGHLRVVALNVAAAADTLPASRWQDVWPAFLAGFHTETLDWKAIHVDADSMASAVLQTGNIHGLTLGAGGVTLPSLHVSGANAMSPDLPDTVVLRASHLGGAWSPEGWHCESRGLNLPGVRFAGDLAWPEVSGHGDLELRWDDLRPWADLVGRGELWTAWELEGDSTLASWDVDSSRWQAHLTGPDWLKATGMGSPSAWAVELGASQLPQPAQAVLSVAELNLRIQGDASTARWSLNGGPTLAMEGQVQSASSLLALATNLSEDWTGSAEVQRWPQWVESPTDRLLASAHVEAGVWNIEAQQDSADVAWRASAQWKDSTVTLRAALPRMPASTGIDSPLDVWGRVHTNATFNSGTWALQAALDDDTLRSTGRLDFEEGLPRWRASVIGAGIEASMRGLGSPAEWSRAVKQASNREPTNWPNLRAEATFAPDNGLTRHILSSVTFNDTAIATLRSGPRGLQGQASVSRWKAGGLELDSTHVTVQGFRSTLYANISVETPDSRPLGAPVMVSLDIHADTSWFANLAADMGQGTVAEWAVEGTPGKTPSAPWSWVAHQGEIPAGFDRLVLAETPLKWTAPLSAPLPSFWRLKGQRGELVFQSRSLGSSGQSLGFYGSFTRLQDLAHEFDPNLSLEALALAGSVDWQGASSEVTAAVDFDAMGVQYQHIHLPKFKGSAAWRNGLVSTSVSASNPEEQCFMEAEGILQPATLATPRLSLEADHVPLDWFQPWVDSSAARLQGNLDVALQAVGLLTAPQISGSGTLTDVQAFVPSLGTSFGGSGGLVVEPDGIYLDRFLLSDARGITTRIEGALFHDAYQDWNLNVGIVDAQENLLIMDLPSTPGAPVFGSLYGRGAVDVMYWNHDITIEGDVVADAPTKFHISLVTESDDGWDEFVHFKRLDVTQTVVEAPTSDLGVTLDLKIQALPAAEVTVVMDEENNANIVGHTEGNIHFVLEDWERMTLNGELRVVEGQYDFALGQFLRKEFVAREGGTLFWNGDPYEGTLDLDAVYTTRANVEPLIGTSSGGGMRNETIDVVLHLRGPMLKPNISFDLEAPKSDRFVAEALSSALVDENDRTNQAIALLSLQEFMPTDFNTLQLGANGLQEYSIDMVTSQLSRWLSKINEDVEVGISYDATSSLNPDLSDNQDALQLALKASFLQDKLEVEGALGSSAITQEALGEARLQNIRINYHLNEAKGLDLTGYSESQTSATQSANSTSQGVGIRWHRSFDWKWPWRQRDAED